MRWIKDPITKLPSVSLTLLMFASLLMVVFIVLEAFQMLKSTALLDEFFMTSVGLYFGRRVGWAGGSVGESVRPECKEADQPAR